MPKRTDIKSSKEIPPPLQGRLGGGASVGRMHLHRAEKLQVREYSRMLRTNSTDAEKKLWQILRGKQLESFRFRRQCPIDKYIADFVCFEQWLIVELDGGQHAEQRKLYDETRTTYLKSQGFRVLRFWNNDVLENIEGVATVILEHLSNPPTQPSPTRGEGFREAATNA